MRRLLGALVCAATLAAPQLADAEQRYVVAAGAEGEACTQGAPCSLKVGIRDAQSGDEVILAPGTYQVDEAIYTEFGVENVKVHGVFAGPVPRIEGTTKFGNAPIGVGTGSRLSYLEIFNEGPYAVGAFCGLSTTVERVRIQVTGYSAAAVREGDGCMVRDSVLLAAGEFSKALLAGAAEKVDRTAVARNVTAVATGSSSVGLFSEFVPVLGDGSITLNAANSAVSGQEADLKAEVVGGIGASTARIVISHSNFDSENIGVGGVITNAGGNQSASPLFVNAAGGDYREAVGSPTIDAGVADQIGALDLGGAARLQGPAPDIGAFEFPAPPAVPQGDIQSLLVGPKSFRAAGSGGAIVSAKKKRKKAPVGASVAYVLSATATATFTVERKTTGRKVTGKCKKQTSANKTKKKCPLYKRVKGSFMHSGAAGQNKFRFSGRLGKALKPGPYRLVGSAGGATRRASFEIVK